MAKSYEELEQENYEMRQFMLDWQNSVDELSKRAEELINKMMPLIPIVRDKNPLATTIVIPPNPVVLPH